MFKIVSIDVSGIKEAHDAIQAYSEAVTSSINARDTDRKQRELETKISNIIGAKVVSGKIGRKESADYLVPNNSSLIQLLYAEATSPTNREGVTPVEFKGATTSGGSTIGQLTVNKQKNLYIPGTEGSFTAADIQRSIFQKKSKEGVLLPYEHREGYLVDLDPKLKKQKDVSAYIFGTYFKKEPRLKQLFYQKASTLLLANSYSIGDATNSRLIGLSLPESYFTSVFFKAAIVDKAIVVSIRDNFQRKIIQELNELVLTSQSTKGLVKSFKIGSKTYKIDYIPALEGQQAFGLEITNSIKARPVDTFILRANIPQKTQKQTNKTQQFISSAQWTVLTQKRLGDTISRFGEPSAPDLKERSGRFRGSIQVTANYKANMLQFSYNPLYSSLQVYGYRPDLQIARSVREVAQQLYAREFNIIRNPSQ